MYCGQSNSEVPIKNERSYDLLGGTPESPQEHGHNSRMTLMSLHEYKIAQCTPHEHKRKPDSTALAPAPSRIPHHTPQVD